ncbi:MAG: hypothetical protein KF744_17660 [Taibaiella sp.]|nr:hypothetical protein [Taibaiella sp.]
MPRILLLLFTIFLPQLLRAQVPLTHPRAVRVLWTDTVSGDFSFRNKWSYQPGVSKMADGQVRCDGFCPPHTEKMLNADGRIIPDSIAAYYRLVDTTHLYHTLASEAHCHEWAGADYITAHKRHDTIAADTYCNPATHCSLRLRIKGDKCYATIIENSIRATRDKPRKRYYCTRGEMTIDSALLKRGILKAGFDFHFRAPKGFGDMYWRGRIYKTIEQPHRYEGMWLN